MPRQKFQRPEVRRAGSGKRAKWAIEYHVYAEDGKRIHKSAQFGLCSRITKADAQQACDRFMVHVNGGICADPQMTLGKWWDVYKETRGARWSPRTHEAYEADWRLHIDPALGRIRLADLRKLDIERWLGKLAPKCGEQLISRVLATLHGMCEDAIDNDLIVKNPCRKVELPRCKQSEETRPLTEDEVRRLWDSLSGRDYLMFRVLILCGPRIGEVLALTREDLDGARLRFDEAAYRGQPSETKTRKTRYAPVPDSLRVELEEWIRKMPAQQALLFPSQRGGGVMWQAGAYLSVLMPAKEASGITDLTFRMCRTTFATLFAGDVKDVQAILGHAKVDMTLAHYRKCVPERAAAAVEEMDRRLKVIPIRKGA